MKYLKLIRIHNILIMAVTLYAIRWAVIFPILKHHNSTLQFSDFNFLLLVLSVCFIAAGGYVINDYFDRKTDRINNPKSVIVGTKINRRFAIILHVVLSFTGVFIGVLVSVKTGHWKYGLIFFFISVILWYYSTSYKRKFLIGNIVISIFTAFVPFIVVLYEIPDFYKIDKQSSTIHIIYIVLGFAFFAFITSMIREIVKDIEDAEGDAKIGCKTMPIVIGTNAAKYIAVLLVLITSISIVLVYTQYLSKLYLLINDNITKWHVLVLATLLLILTWLILKAKGKKDFHVASILVKVIMLVGMLYSVVLFYLIK